MRFGHLMVVKHGSMCTGISRELPLISKAPAKTRHEN